jgi:hypothetical protein
MTNYTLLGTGGHGTGSQSYDYGGDYYSNVGLGRHPMKQPPFTTEPNVQQIIRVAGTVSYLSWGLDTAFGTTLTLALRVNSSNSALAVSNLASTTGWFTDSTHSASVSSGDLLDFRAHVASGSETSFTYIGYFFCTSARFVADTASAQMLATVGPDTFDAPFSSDNFVNFLGILAARVTNETDQQFDCLAPGAETAAGTWQNMACYVDSNGFTQSTTITNRINGSPGSMGISIAGGQTGYLEADAAQSDLVNIGDKLDYGVSTPETSLLTLTMDWIGAHFPAAGAASCMVGGSAGSPEMIIGTTNYSSLFGAGKIYNGNLVARATGLFPYTLSATKFTNYRPGDQSGDATFTLLKNGSPSALAVSSTGGGYWTDNTDTVAFAVGDTCANEVEGAVPAWAYGALLLTAC